MIQEQLAILSQRLDVMLAEADRLESILLAEGNDVTARDIACVALELRLARRSLASILPVIDPTPLRSLASVGGRDHLTAPRAGPA